MENGLIKPKNNSNVDKSQNFSINQKVLLHINMYIKRVMNTDHRT